MDYTNMVINKWACTRDVNNARVSRSRPGTSKPSKVKVKTVQGQGQ